MATQLETHEARCDELGSISVKDMGKYYPLAHQPGYFMAVCALPSWGLRRQIKEVSDQLRVNFPDHHYVPETYFHLTIAGLGGIATAHEVSQLHRTLRPRLQDISRDTGLIDIVVNGLNSFRQCVFAQVSSESDTLDNLHNSLRGIPHLGHQLPFVPHITMIYPEGSPDALVRHVDTFFSDASIGTDTLSSIYLTVMDGSRSIDDATPYDILEMYNLSDG